MRRNFAFGMAFVALLVLLWATGGVVAGPPADGPEGETHPQGDVSIAAYISPMMSYQGRLVENGTPVTGSRNMIFRLYNVASGGTPLWEENHTGATVTNGLFNVTFGGITPMDVNDFAQPLWLEIVVEGTTLPRQRLLGAPYAYSLVPGADVEGNIDGAWSVLFVSNAGTGRGVTGYSLSGWGVYGWSNSSHGVYAKSGGSARAGAALWAENTNTTNGIAIWADNESSDTTLVVRNKGSGPLIKGFGGDGGGHEFIVTNAGDVWYEGALLGAFPRPAYDSGWVAIAPGEAKTLTHNLGGNTDNYVVDLQFRGGTSALFADPHIREIGGQQRSDGKWHGAYWRSLTPTTITVFRQYDSTDQFFTEFRLRIWVYK